MSAPEKARSKMFDLRVEIRDTRDAMLAAEQEAHAQGDDEFAQTMRAIWRQRVEELEAFERMLRSWLKSG